MDIQLIFDIRIIHLYIKKIKVNLYIKLLTIIFTNTVCANYNFITKYESNDFFSFFFLLFFYIRLNLGNGISYNVIPTLAKKITFVTFGSLFYLLPLFNLAITVHIFIRYVENVQASHRQDKNKDHQPEYFKFCNVIIYLFF